jgi:hypothetical protein
LHSFPGIPTGRTNEGLSTGRADNAPPPPAMDPNPADGNTKPGAKREKYQTDHREEQHTRYEHVQPTSNQQVCQPPSPTFSAAYCSFFQLLRVLYQRLKVGPYPVGNPTVCGWWGKKQKDDTIVGECTNSIGWWLPHWPLAQSVTGIHTPWHVTSETPRSGRHLTLPFQR